jgi:CheY-like chemotaxis protein
MTGHGVNEMSARILIIEDDDARAWELESLCCELGFEVLLSPDDLHGLMRAVADQPDLILLDLAAAKLGMTQMADVAARDVRISSIPIVAISGDDREEPRRTGVDVVAGGAHSLLRSTLCRALKCRREGRLSAMGPASTPGVDARPST